VQLKGGAIFQGSLVVDRAGGGIESRPARIQSYGRGPARIQAGSDTALLLRETPWIIVSNLVLRGDPSGQGDGIRCDRVQESTKAIEGIEILRCHASGFAWHGIMVDASQRSSGFDRVRISECTTEQNRHAGIMVYGGNPTGRRFRPHSRIVIERCVSRNNPGAPEELQHHSGSGILLDGVDRGLIQGCVASGNGAECRNDRGGPVGIWIHASRSVVIEDCESHHNQSTLRDGGGFDLDGGCEDSVLRFNFSHHNHGPGLMAYTYTGAAYSDRDCRIQNNVSWNDGAPGSGYAGLQIGSEDGGQIRGLKVENNLVVAPARSTAAVRVTGRSIEAELRHNLVIGAQDGALVSISGFDHALRFIDNRYWRPNGTPLFLVDSKWSIPALGSWKNAMGPDSRFRSSDESFGNPGLRIELPDTGTAQSLIPRVPRLRFGWDRIPTPLEAGPQAP